MQIRAARASGAARTLAVAAVCLLAALTATWPLGTHLLSAVPLGTERAATVPLFSLWNLWWTGDRIGHGMHGYWDAPFFYPNDGVTTYSEPMPLVGFLAAPLWAAGAPPAFIYDAALLALLTLNGISAYRLARVLRVSTTSALLGGILAVTLPFVAKTSGVLPNVPLFGIFVTLESLVRFGRGGSWSAAAWASGGFLMTYLTFEQYALFSAPLALAGAIVALSMRGFNIQASLRLGGCGLLAGLLIFALARPGMETRERSGFERPISVVRALSAKPHDFLTRPEHAIVAVPHRDAADTGGLFPGVALSALGLAGIAAAIRDRGRRRWAVYFSACALASLLLALGLNLSLAGWHPFGTLRDLVPSYAQVRSPYRAAALFQAFLVPLAAIALNSVRQLPIRGAAVLTVTVGVVAAAENLSARSQLLPLPHTPRTAWTTWLRTRPQQTVAHVPFPAGLNVSDYQIEAWRLFHQIDHRRPLVNGYSGYFPQARTPEGTVIPTYTLFQLAMARQFPSYQLLCVLRKSIGANVLVVARSWLTQNQHRLRPFDAFLRRAYQDSDVRIYQLTVPAGECRTE